MDKCTKGLFVNMIFFHVLKHLLLIFLSDAEIAHIIFCTLLSGTSDFE